ncbi:MAG: DUF4149 domain-containing protein [Sulfuritalea sp.]|nr:DUF4149 domain-containing protein [Sulfuritalea sp.]
MRRLAESFYSISITLWVGGVWAIGFIAAPALFAVLPDRALAGDLAGKLFGIIAWVGIVCAAYLLAYFAWRWRRSLPGKGVFWLVLTMLLLVLAGHFGIEPILTGLKAEAWPLSVMSDATKSRFVFWHGLAGGLYVLQSLLGAALVLLQDRGR